MTAARMAAHTQGWFALEEFAYGSWDYESRAGDAAPVTNFGPTTQVGLHLVSVHATSHWRGPGTSKCADRGTGSLVESLAAAACVPGAVFTRRPASHSRQGAQLAQLVRECASGRPLVLDVHGMRDQRDLDAEIGFGIAPTPAEVAAGWALVALLRAHGLRVAVNEVFTAAAPANVTNSVRAAGGRAFQLEIAARARPPVGSPARAQALYSALFAFAQTLTPASTPTVG